ncbi:MAG: TIM barrel protein [Fimbriimonas sp.]|nr:TIM barrel protein [Fimbriimonas sp.]
MGNLQARPNDRVQTGVNGVDSTWRIAQMTISIASFSFHGALSDGTIDVFGYLEACRYRYHLDTADIWNGLLGPDVETQLDPERLAKVRRAMNERDLVCVNYHADGCHVWEDDAETRVRHHELALRHLQAAETLGATTVRIDTGGRGREWTNEEFDAIATAFREYSEFAGNAGFKFGPETHWGATNYPDNMLKLHAAVGSPHYGILLHMGKDTSTSPDEYDKALAPIAIHTHIDQRTSYERLADALAILMDSGYKGVLGVEHHTGKNEFAEVEAQIGLLRRAISHYRQGRGEGYTGNPLLDAKNERAHN